MDRQAKIDILNRVLHGVVNSVLQYMEAATPYIPEGDEEKWGEILRIRDEEVEIAHELHGAIGALDGVASIGSFPYWNIDLNYLDLCWVAGFAKRHQDRVTAEIEQVLPLVRGDARVHGLLTRVLETQRAHATVLDAVAAKPEAAEQTDGA